MASHHASLGRRTLEEIRQKRAAQKLSKTSSGPDITKPPSPKGNLFVDQCVKATLNFHGQIH
ncbi:hypothetical protein LXL04_036393 [Taraxacum kok-saghyz]